MTAEAALAERQQTQQGAEVEATRSRPTFVPCTNIYEREDAIVVEADMPGVGPDSVDVNLDGDELTIAGQVADVPIEGHELSYAEYEVGDYRCKFRISAAIDADKIEAAMKNGVLHVVLPKSEEARPHKIEVKAG
jgi:HSP20 family molecular chaperone IbpA